MPGRNEAIVLKDLVSEAPRQKFDNVFTATLEKILVDIFCDAEFFGGFQGAELMNIFSSAMEKYIIQSSRMLRYASRRGKRKEIAAYIEQLPKNRQ